MARKRQCICCTSKYEYCSTCRKDSDKPSWMSTFCSEACKELWSTAVKYNMNLISKPEAKAAIEALELKEKSEYVECVQRDLEVIMAPEKVAEDVQPVAEPLEVEQQFTPKKKQKSHEVVKKEDK